LVIPVSKENIVSIRLSDEERTRLIQSARRQKKSLTGLIRKRLAPDIGEGKDTKRLSPSNAAREALARYIGGTRSRKRTRLTNEEIDRIVYGQH